jgi:c-di-AMP phosphodiesterase-like protein
MCQLPMIFWATGHEVLPLNAMPASVAGLNNLMIYSIICNANWMITTGFLVLSLAGSFVYYTLMYNYLDFITIAVVSTTMLFVIYAIYKTEYRDKSELIGVAEIRRMNEELKNILMGLPEGIVLISEKNG